MPIDFTNTILFYWEFRQTCHRLFLYVMCPQPRLISTASLSLKYISASQSVYQSAMIRVRSGSVCLCVCLLWSEIVAYKLLFKIFHGLWTRFILMRLCFLHRDKWDIEVGTHVVVDRLDPVNVQKWLIFVSLDRIENRELIGYDEHRRGRDSRG